MSDKDQSQVTEESKTPEGPQSLGELMDEGWEKTVGKEEPKPEEKEKEVKPEEKTEKVETKEEECADCDEKEKVDQANLAKLPVATEKNIGDGIWPKAMKIQGRLRQVNSPKELLDGFSMESDYRLKTQNLAKEKETWEGEYKSRAEKMTAENQKVMQIYQFLVDQGHVKAPGAPQKTQAEEKAELYAKYSVDPEVADEAQIKMIDDLYAQSKQLNTVSQKVSGIEEKEMGLAISDMVKDAQKQYPINDVIEDGNNKSFELFQAIFAQKLLNDNKLPKEQQTPVKNLVFDSVRMVSEAQKGNGKQPPEEKTMEEKKESKPLSEEDLKTKHIAEYLKEQQSKDSAPPLSPASPEATIRKDKLSLEDSTDPLKDAIDKGYKELDL